MPKVTFIGPGSAVFARQLITDILAVDEIDRLFAEMGQVEKESRRAFA